MRAWGAVLILIGLAGTVAPLAGVQFKLVELFGGRPESGLGIAAVGVVLFAIGTIRERAGSTPDSPHTTAPVSTPPTAAPSTGRTACSRCGEAIPAGDVFCSACGTPVKPPAPAACALCGATLKSTDSFCSGCGQPVGAAAPIPAQNGLNPVLRLALLAIAAASLFLVGKGVYDQQKAASVRMKPAPETGVQDTTGGAASQSGIQDTTGGAAGSQGSSSTQENPIVILGYDANGNRVLNPGNAPSGSGTTTPPEPRLGR